MPDCTTDETLIEDVLSAYPVRWTRYEHLHAWYGKHLRVRLWDEQGDSYQLRERPYHINLQDWQLHHELQGNATELTTIPRLQRTRAGTWYTEVDGRDFELISWLPGTCRGLLEAWQFQALGQAMGELHARLFALPLPAHSTRTIATTNDMAMWIGELRRDSYKAKGATEFCDLAEQLLASLPVGNRTGVHGDIHPYNVLWQDNRVSGFCDWEDAHLNTPAFDLAYLLTHSTFIHWPERLPAGREAFVRDAIHETHTRLLLASYRDALGRPLDTTGFHHALVTTWVSTMRLTVLRNFIDAPTIAEGRRILDWLAKPDCTREWEAILQ